MTMNIHVTKKKEIKRKEKKRKRKKKKRKKPDSTTSSQT